MVRAALAEMGHDVPPIDRTSIESGFAGELADPLRALVDDELTPTQAQSLKNLAKVFDLAAISGDRVSIVMPVGQTLGWIKL